MLAKNNYLKIFKVSFCWMNHLQSALIYLHYSNTPVSCHCFQEFSCILINKVQVLRELNSNYQHIRNAITLFEGTKPVFCDLCVQFLCILNDHFHRELFILHLLLLKFARKLHQILLNNNISKGRVVQLGIHVCRRFY